MLRSSTVTNVLKCNNKRNNFLFHRRGAIASATDIQNDVPQPQTRLPQQHTFSESTNLSNVYHTPSTIFHNEKYCRFCVKSSAERHIINHEDSQILYHCNLNVTDLARRFKECDGMQNTANSTLAEGNNHINVSDKLCFGESHQAKIELHPVNAQEDDQALATFDMRKGQIVFHMRSRVGAPSVTAQKYDRQKNVDILRQLFTLNKMTDNSNDFSNICVNDDTHLQKKHKQENSHYTDVKQVYAVDYV